MNWYIKVLSNYANFSGRARRKEYWMFVLFNFITGFGIGLVAAFAGKGDLGTKIGYIYNLAILLPSIAVGIRRMHDTNHSGWWILCPFYNLYLLCVDGELGSNQYGPNPKMDIVPLAMGATG